MVPIYTLTVGAGAGNSVTFNNIPQGYTDLMIVHSIRSATAGGITWDDLLFQINDDSSAKYSLTINYGIPPSGLVATRGSNGTNFQGGWVASSTAASNIFSNATIYFPNYSGGNLKTGIVDTITTSTVSQNVLGFSNILYSSTDPIRKLRFFISTGGNFVQNSTITLYGINARRSTQKAIGGDVTTDGTYWYHTFKSVGSSTFIPNENLGAECLVLAGGGGGGAGDNGSSGGGGGGAGGILVGSYLLNSGTQYTVNVGGGGAGGTIGNAGVSGSNSFISGLNIATSTAIGGGFGGGGGGTASSVAGTGGSGGGNARTGAFGLRFYSQGNSGGQGTGGGGAGGGGSASVGGINSGNTGGAGGSGTGVFTNWGITTGVGNNISGVAFFAGGGSAGTGSPTGGTSTPGSIGGGGAGGTSGTAGSPGLANTGSGGGGGGAVSGTSPAGGAGGSGVVIIRYPV